MAEYKGVLVCGELISGELAAITKELLTLGRKLADDLGEDLSLLIMGEKLGDLGKKAFFFGADKVYLAQHPLLSQYHPDFYLEVVSKLCQEIKPSILLLGQTDLGRDLAPRLAARLGSGACLDCIELNIDPEKKLLLATRPVFGGNALAIKTWEKPQIQIVTVRPKSISPKEIDSSKQGEIVNIDVKLDETMAKIQIIDRIKEEVEGIKLEDAEVVVTGGRGIGGVDGFELLKELARLLRGAVGGTRAACEEGWLPTSLQVGQTGKIVSPNLYIAVALSGAMQHLAGCSGSKNIVAINKDPEANIFRVARFGVVGDYRQAIPALIAKIKELMAK